MSAYGNDCHFYYNSSCTKGDQCAFRHCEVAKDCQNTCTFWQQGICSKPNCPYRHAELQPERNRQAIPCYWENQPAGCNKPNCQYQHFKSRPNDAQPPLQTNPVISEPVLPDTSVPPPMFGQLPVTQPTPLPGVPVIQPVVVHFSDSEVESEKNSPVKLRKTGNQVPPSTSVTRTINIGQNGQGNKQVKSSNIVSKVSSSTNQISTINSHVDVTASSTVPIPTIQAGTSQMPSSNQAGSDMTKPGQIPIIQSGSQTKPSSASSTGLSDLDYFIGRPYLHKSNRSPVRTSPRYDSSPDRRSYDSRYSRSPSPRSLSPWRRRSRSPSPRRSRSPRRRSPSYSRDRSRSPRRWSPRRRSPSPRRYNLNKNSISRPQDRYLQGRRPGYGRQSRGRNDSPSMRGQRPVEISSQKKISLSKIKDSADSSEDKIKVKSLEEIQRAKALLSMGLIELESGKIVKVGEVEKYKELKAEERVKKEPYKELQAEEKVKKEPTKKRKIIKKVIIKSKKPKKKESPVKKIEEKAEEDKLKEENTNDDYGDDLDDLGEEPEIDIYEAIDDDIEDTGSQGPDESEDVVEEEDEDDDEEEEEEEEEEEQASSSEEEPVEYQEDIRRAVRKEPEITPPQPQVINTQLKRKRNVVVEEKRQKEEKQNMEVKQRISIHSRLGRKVDSTDVKRNSTRTSKDTIDSKVGNLQKSLIKASVKSRVGTCKQISDNTVGSSNTGTVKGIKSRLGIGAIKSDTSESEVSSSEPRKLVLKRTIENNREEDDIRKEVTKRRRWNQGSAKSRLGQSGSDTSVVDTDLKKIVITRNIFNDEDSKSNDGVKQNRQTVANTSRENKSQVKSTLSRINKIIEEKKESKDQDAPKRNFSKLNIWSSRVSESIAAVAPSRKESNIDLQDSSSNDSLTADPGLSRKEAKAKKLLKQERAIYVPPGRKRPAASYDDQEEEKEISPPNVNKKHKEKHIEKNSEPETIKTYSQIMEEKRKKLEKQREKKAVKAEEKAMKKKLKKDKENEKSSKVTVDTTENKQPRIKQGSSERRDSLLDSFDFLMPDKSEKAPSSRKPESTADDMDLLTSVTPKNSKMEQEKVHVPPSRKKSDDSWLEFSKEDLELTVDGDTADDDDLLREIDELLA